MDKVKTGNILSSFYDHTRKTIKMCSYYRFMIYISINKPSAVINTIHTNNVSLQDFFVITYHSEISNLIIMVCFFSEKMHFHKYHYSQYSSPQEIMTHFVVPVIVYVQIISNQCRRYTVSANPDRRCDVRTFNGL